MLDLDHNFKDLMPGGQIVQPLLLLSFISFTCLAQYKISVLKLYVDACSVIKVKKCQRDTLATMNSCG